MKRKTKYLVLLPLFTFTVFAFSCFAAYLCLKYSGSIIAFSGGGKIGQIFNRLKTANIRPSYLVSFVLSAAFASLNVFILSRVKNKAVKLISVAAVTTVSLLAVTLFAILFANVNGIRVLNVFSSLIKALKNGLLNELRVSLL